MLTRGSTGDEVIKLQKGLALVGVSPGEADGVFGANTEAAVKTFQESAGLTVDGIYGPDTKKALKTRRAAAKSAKKAKKAKKATEATAPSADAGGGTTPV